MMIFLNFWIKFCRTWNKLLIKIMLMKYYTISLTYYFNNFFLIQNFSKGRQNRQSNCQALIH